MQPGVRDADHPAGRVALHTAVAQMLTGPWTLHTQMVDLSCLLRCFLVSLVVSLPALSAALTPTVLKRARCTPFQATAAEHLHALLEVIPGAFYGQVARPQLSLVLLRRHLADGNNRASLLRVSVLCIDYMALPANRDWVAAKGLREVV